MSSTARAPRPLTDLITVVAAEAVIDPPGWLTPGAVYHHNAVFDWVRDHPTWHLVVTDDADALPGPPTAISELRTFELRHAEDSSA
jgi:hypothetical protein